MLSPLIPLLRQHRLRYLDKLVVRILESVPHYSLIDLPELRHNLDLFLDDLLQVIEHQEKTSLMNRTIAVCQKRIAQGISLGDFLRAILLTVPVVREVTQELVVIDTVMEQALTEIEGMLHYFATTAADIYVDIGTRKLTLKNQELNRLNQRLQAQERALSMEMAQVHKALASVNEFNHRVIESLTCGIVVIDSQTLKVTLYSSRMEEILGIPAEAVLGQAVGQAFATIEGFNAESMVELVRTVGHLPLTRVRVRLPSGRFCSVYLRAQRLYNAEGEPEGTVVVVDDITERELLIESFSRYVSRDVLQRLLARAQPLGLEGERRTCTIFFVDIRGFTKLAEILAPEALHELLNAYFRVTIDAIIAHGGFIDKFVGDKVMAIFMGVSAAEAATAALQAGLQVKEDIQLLSRERVAEGLPPIEIGIGINTGEVLLGNIGSEERMDFTAIGDTVNVADRLQSLAQKGEILIGEKTARLATHQFMLVEQGSQLVKGRSNPVKFFKLLVQTGIQERPAEPVERSLETLEKQEKTRLATCDAVND
jgi:PAS domain S-box-containing protein